MSFLIKNVTVVTLNSHREVIENGAVLIKKDRIEAVGDASTLSAQCGDETEIINGHGQVVLPGFVSAHNHLGYAVFRGRAEDVGHAPTHRLYLPMSGVISNEERQVIGSLAVVELLRGGVTTVLEMEEDAELFAPFIEKSGIRALIGVMVNDLNLDALARGETVFDPAARELQLEKAVGLAQRWHGKSDHRIQAILAATGLSTSSPELLDSLRAFADELRLCISIHLGFGERDLVKRVHQAKQFEFARDHGVLGSDVVAVHCFEVDEAEIDILAETGTRLAHCPHMNQFRGEVAPVHRMREKGIQIGLGIDNYFSDYFEVLRSCLASARIHAHDPEVFSAYDALAFGTIDAARVLGLDDEIGSIEKGKKADLQMIDMATLGLTPVNDPVTTLVYHGHAKDVKTVFVDGNLVVREGVVQTADQADLIHRAGDAANNAWQKFRERHGAYAAPPPN